ncbi:YkgJ family cysteine cluster protein [Methanoplanus sp. FWC-SCC4]|uniref:YkgJ family cysteine cluster protein n=1 Tax=Methanochimaera problematica TaxID=2609417 RepID=A0AA97FCX6_9EURY|nr:YkgJ family cysteine cluster protein [Methanoplanus sp. FWC-SCC4]WOF16572.1 YkgJ family cysteine cluster protein [Methanoplanus sp. FWC-SCC4]
MQDREKTGQEIKKTGFQCRMCGECCSNVSEDSNLVLLSAPEIREIIEATQLSWNDIAEPYPETFSENDSTFTFAWCLRRNEKNCIFLGPGNRCKIYKHRPLICRTYPFMITEDGLTAFECPGLGEEITKEEALMLSDELICRKEKEDMEFNKISNIYENTKMPRNSFCVIDSEGVKKIG